MPNVILITLYTQYSPYSLLTQCSAIPSFVSELIVREAGAHRLVICYKPSSIIVIQDLLNGLLVVRTWLRLAIHYRFPYSLGIISQSIHEFMIEILWKFCLFWFWHSNQVIVLHMSRQLSCPDMGKVVAWLDHYFLCNSYTYFYQYLDNELIVTLWNAVSS